MCHVSSKGWRLSETLYRERSSWAKYRITAEKWLLLIVGNSLSFPSLLSNTWKAHTRPEEVSWTHAKPTVVERHSSSTLNCWREARSHVLMHAAPAWAVRRTHFSVAGEYIYSRICVEDINGTAETGSGDRIVS